MSATKKSLPMTPREYLKIEKAQRKIIKAAERRIREARERADRCPPPKNRRPAVARDIVEGAIIWHERKQEHGGDYWNIVEAPLHYGSSFRAYRSGEGDSFGLHGAYVETKGKTK